MKNIIKSAWILIINDWLALLVKHWEKAGHITWSYWIPAGRFEENETSKECAVRELFEETGILWNVNSLIDFPEIYIAELNRKNGKKNFSLEVFLCIEYKWFLKESEENTPERINIKDIDQINLLPNMEKIIKKWLEINKDISL